MAATKISQMEAQIRAKFQAAVDEWISTAIGLESRPDDQGGPVFFSEVIVKILAKNDDQVYALVKTYPEPPAS